MSKLNIIEDYYEPLKFIKKHCHEESPLQSLNRAYKATIRKIILQYPTSYSDSFIYNLCLEKILTTTDMTKVTVMWIEEQIKYDDELNQLKQDDETLVKLQLIKRVTEAHQANLKLVNYIHKSVVPYLKNILFLEEKLDSYLYNREKSLNNEDEVNEYNHQLFPFFQKKYSEKKEAINDLKKALKGKPVDLLPNLPILRNGELGKSIREFVKQGLADLILNGVKVNTVTEFITTLNQQINQNHASSKSCELNF